MLKKPIVDISGSNGGEYEEDSCLQPMLKQEILGRVNEESTFLRISLYKLNANRYYKSISLILVDLILYMHSR